MSERREAGIPPSIVALEVAGEADAWRAAGFAVDERGVTVIGGVELHTGHDGRGITSWVLRDAVLSEATVDGLPTSTSAAPIPAPVVHPNTSTLIDHLVFFSPDGARTSRAFEQLGWKVRRTRDTERGDSVMRQTFFRAGEVILELAAGADSPEPSLDPATAPAAFFGIACTVADIDACQDLLRASLGSLKDAVQPGRKIVTLRHRELGLTVPIAFMTPPPTGGGA